MRARVVLLCALVTILPLSATAQDQGGETERETSLVTFYGHVFSHGLDFPMPANTEKPIGEDNYGIGTGASCISGVPDPSGEVSAGDCDSVGFNKLALFSSAGFVDVKNSPEFFQNGQYALFHNERGSTKDIVLDTSQKITASIYFTMDAHGWPVRNQYGTNCLYPHPPDVPCLYPYWGWDPGVYSDVVVEATLYMATLGTHKANASDQPDVLGSLDRGEAEVVATGRWGPETVTNGIPGAPSVNQFVVDLGTPKVALIPREKTFFLVYNVYQETNGQAYLLRGPMRWWSGELFPPTFTLPVKNAFDVERVIPNFAHGKLAILGVMNTPWGSYDIEPRSVKLTVTDANGAELEPGRVQRFGEFSVAHGGHYLPINITWIWDYQADRLKAGPYTVTVSAANFQQSATAACTATFELKESSRGLVSGKVQEGVCGLQSSSEEFIEGIREGATS